MRFPICLEQLLRCLRVRRGLLPAVQLPQQGQVCKPEHQDYTCKHKVCQRKEFNSKHKYKISENFSAWISETRKAHLTKERLGKKSQIRECTYAEKNMPLGTSLNYRLSIQFRKENADGTTINNLTLSKLAVLTEILALHSV